MNSVRYYIGIDAGGSKSNLSLYNKNLNKVLERQLPAFNFLADRSEEKLNIIFSEINELKSKYNISGIGMGVAGIDSESDSKKLRKIIAEKYSETNIAVINDGVACLAGALMDKAGILINSGTGSIAIGRDKKENVFRAGGWDYIIGDEGSGYWIAMEFIRKALLNFDRGKNSNIIKVVKNHFDADSMEAVVNYIYSSDFNKEKVASLAEEISDLAETGNNTALNIYKKSGRKLAELVEIVYKKGKFNGETLLTYNGSIFKSFNLFADEFFSYLDDNNVRYIWCEPEREPEAGAAMLVKKLEDNI